MDLWSIVKSVGSAVVRDAVPGGGAIIDAVNAVLPADKKLPSNATGHDAANAIQALPPEQRSAVMQKEYDVDIATIQARSSTLQAAIEADVKNPQSTRPRIALGAFQVVAYAMIVAISAWAYGVIKADNPLTAVQNGWPFILSVIGPFVVLLRAYFGVLRDERKAKLNAATGSPTDTAISAIVKAIKGGK